MPLVQRPRLLRVAVPHFLYAPERARPRDGCCFAFVSGFHSAPAPIAQTSSAAMRAPYSRELLRLRPDASAASARHSRVGQPRKCAAPDCCHRACHNLHPHRLTSGGQQHQRQPQRSPLESLAASPSRLGASVTTLSRCAMLQQPRRLGPTLPHERDVAVLQLPLMSGCLLYRHFLGLWPLKCKHGSAEPLRVQLPIALGPGRAQPRCGCARSAAAPTWPKAPLWPPAPFRGPPGARIASLIENVALPLVPIAAAPLLPKPSREKQRSDRQECGVWVQASQATHRWPTPTGASMTPPVQPDEQRAAQMTCACTPSSH
eukprot:scaffold18964_cov24-Tisochrysis_lutea.AAC.2